LPAAEAEQREALLETGIHWKTPPASHSIARGMTSRRLDSTAQPIAQAR